MCGIFGIKSPNETEDVASAVYYGMLALQHRGQESFGIASYLSASLKEKLQTWRQVGISLDKHLGLVNQLALEDFRKFQGNPIIGHIRYATAGHSPLQDAQPVFRDYPSRGISLCHNGNIVNLKELREELQKNGRHLNSMTDTEPLLHIFADVLQKNHDLEKAVKTCSDRLDGAYSFLAISGDGELMAFRDPLGIRPLCYGKIRDAHVLASESIALDINGGTLGEDIRPGELISIDSKGNMERKQVVKSKNSAFCMFEYVYFSRPDSVINGKSVHDVRVKLGENLARDSPADADIIVPVPDTSRSAAEGFSKVSGIPVAEGLIKNRYVGRTFIMPGQANREAAVRVKLNAMRAVLKDKSIVLIDDSIVRGTTSKAIVDMVRKQGGAKEIHMRITCPPIISPCFYGIDMATHEELIAAKMPVEEIKKRLGVDSLAYQTVEGLVDAIGFPKDRLCTACVTGKYPTAGAQKMADTMKGKNISGRYYEA